MTGIALNSTGIRISMGPSGGLDYIFADASSAWRGINAHLGRM